MATGIVPGKWLLYSLKTCPSVFSVELVWLKSMVEVPIVCAAMVRKSLWRSISLKSMA